MQFLATTWTRWSTDVAGRELPFTAINERYVALEKVDGWLDEGLTETQIAKIWNQGHTGPCSAGVNSHGVAYDSCAYVRQILARL